VTRVAVPVFVWAAFLTVLATVLALWERDNVPKVIFFASAAVMWLVGIYAAVRGRRPAHVRVTPDLSYAAVFVAFAIAMLALGALVGLWLVLIGGGSLLIGLAGIARELAAQRREL
jgi:hypothetical protein